jgi:hypothetical protein
MEKRGRGSVTVLGATGKSSRYISAEEGVTAVERTFVVGVVRPLIIARTFPYAFTLHLLPPLFLDCLSLEDGAHMTSQNFDK